MNYQYGLTELETKTIQAVEFSPLENIADVAKQAKLKTNSLAASVRRLKDKKIIKLEAIFNPFAVGSLPVAVYGQLLEKDDNAKKSLLERMFKSPNITYIFETLGQYNFYFSIISENLNSIPCIMRDLFESHGDIFSGKLIAPRLELILYPKKFLGSFKTTSQIICLSPKSGLVFKPDELDQAILDQVCNNGFDSFRQVAKALSEPASTVERRIRRLQEHNVISGFRYAINRESLKTQHARLLLSKKGFLWKYK